jgi:hypothetical protein
MTKDEAALRVAETVVVASVEAAVPYKGDWLVRVKHANKEEADFDPFFLVKSTTGEVSEFSIMTDGDPAEVAAAFEAAGA